MATVISVMDGARWGSNTDNIVVADSARRCLLWVPRDLWFEEIRHRINKAFARGGHELLLKGLAALRLPAEHSLCVSREAVERALKGVSVTVPVITPMAYWYPLSPRARIEEGRKRVVFLPPAEVLSGERLHQWIGARYGEGWRGTDLDRIRRQQVLVRALLADRFDFASLLADPDHVRLSSPEVLAELKTVDASWHFDCIDDVSFERIDGMSVLRRHESDFRP